jgi:isopenicillin N synthase-like dioxygenase
MVVPATKILAFAEAPVVDISPLVTGDAERIPAVVEEIARACESVGFMYVRGHGVSVEALNAVVKEAENFFVLPLHDKRSVALERSPQFRGYLPLEYTGNEGEEGKNLQEGFLMMHDRPVDAKAVLHGSNQWPPALPSLQPAMTTYFREMERLAHKMLPGFAMALGLTPDYFGAAYEKSMMVVKLNHYPPQSVTDATKMIGVGGHCDGGGFTILWQDSQGGLEIINKDGDWIGVPPLEGTFVINIGNMLHRWTNGRFSSTEHRVINRYGKDRYSIACFVDPSFDTMVGPIVDKTESDEPPIKCGEYLHSYYSRIYPQMARAAE